MNGCVEYTGHAVSWMIFLAVLLLCTSMAPAASPRAVPTFESVGIYWKPDSPAAGAECSVRYREGWRGRWREALPLWFDARDGEYRGSIVGLKPGTRYKIRLSLAPRGTSATVRTQTWSERLPVGRIYYIEPGVHLEPLVIQQGGGPGRYALYTVRKGETATIDVTNQHPSCVEVFASHVIVRGLVLKGARQDAIELFSVHDVCIEDCDISGWGRGGQFAAGDAGIICRRLRNVTRLIVQRNRIHHPRYDSNNWLEERHPGRGDYHPGGPQAICWGNTSGNHVIRYNEITSQETHYFNDGIGGWSNFSRQGFPGPDSDVYGNVVTHCWDDALEIEGGGCNVRVWGNYIDKSKVGIATTACTVGPLYVFRNVFAESRWAECPGGDTDASVGVGTSRERMNRGNFAKVGEAATGGSGRQYWFHNTMLQPDPPVGRSLTLGARSGLHYVGHTGMISELVSLNNIWHVCHTAEESLVDWPSIYAGTEDPVNVFDYDLYNGSLRDVHEGAEAHGIRGVPIYAPGHGPDSGLEGHYQLDRKSPGYDAAKRIPNFNDDFHGAAPDIGAHESGSAPMQFGAGAYRDVE